MELYDLELELLVSSSTPIDQAFCDQCERAYAAPDAEDGNE